MSVMQSDLEARRRRLQELAQQALGYRYTGTSLDDSIRTSGLPFPAERIEEALNMGYDPDWRRKQTMVGYGGENDTPVYDQTLATRMQGIERSLQPWQGYTPGAPTGRPASLPPGATFVNRSPAAGQAFQSGLKSQAVNGQTVHSAPYSIQGNRVTTMDPQNEGWAITYEFPGGIPQGWEPGVPTYMEGALPAAVTPQGFQPQGAGPTAYQGEAGQPGYNANAAPQLAARLGYGQTQLSPQVQAMVADAQKNPQNYGGTTVDGRQVFTPPPARTLAAPTQQTATVAPGQSRTAGDFLVQQAGMANPALNDDTARARQLALSGNMTGATDLIAQTLMRMGMPEQQARLQARSNVTAFLSGGDSTNQNTTTGQWFGKTPDPTISLGPNALNPANLGGVLPKDPRLAAEEEARRDLAARENIFRGTQGGQAVNSDPYNGAPLGIPNTPEAKAVVVPSVLQRLTKEALGRVPAQASPPVGGGPQAAPTPQTPASPSATVPASTTKPSYPGYPGSGGTSTPTPAFPKTGAMDAPAQPTVMSSTGYQPPPQQGVPVIPGSAPFNTYLQTPQDALSYLPGAMTAKYNDPANMAKVVDAARAILQPLLDRKKAVREAGEEGARQKVLTRLAGSNLLYSGTREQAEKDFAYEQLRQDLSDEEWAANQALSQAMPFARLGLDENQQIYGQALSKADLSLKQDSANVNRARAGADLAKSAQDWRYSEAAMPLDLAGKAAGVDATRTRTAAEVADQRRRDAMQPGEQALQTLKVKAAQLEDEIARDPNVGTRAQKQAELDRAKAQIAQAEAATEATRVSTDKTKALLPGEVTRQKIDNAMRELERKANNDALFQKNNLYPLQRELQELKLQAERIAAKSAPQEAALRLKEIEARIDQIISATAENYAQAAKARKGGDSEGSFTAWQQYQILRDQLQDKRYTDEQKTKAAEKAQVARQKAIDAYRVDYTVGQPAAELWIDIREVLSTPKGDGSIPTQAEVTQALLALMQQSALPVNEKQWLTLMVQAVYGDTDAQEQINARFRKTQPRLPNE